MSELTIPNQSPSTWEPGVGVGALYHPSYYRPGGGGARTVEYDVVADWGVDPTGATTVHSIITSNLGLVGANEVIKFPYGRFKFTSFVYFGAKKNFTVRGGGMGVPSGSSVSFGTGTKTFQVPAGLDWTPGIGGRVWEENKQYKWMKGTVVSYSGTTLVLNITSTSGHVGSISRWTVGQTIFERTMSGSFFVGAQSYGNPGGETVANILGSPSAGATSITVNSSAGFATGLCKLDMTTPPDAEFYSTYGYRTGQLLTINYIDSIVGNVLTLRAPLAHDCPATLSPVIYSSIFHYEGFGLEDVAMFGEDWDGNGSPMISFQGGYNCWAYKVVCCITRGMVITTEASLRCELNRVVFGWTKDSDGLGSTEGAIRSSASNEALYVHCLDYSGCQLGEGQPDTGCAYLYNTFKNAPPNANHGNVFFQLWEGNVLPSAQWDGYYAVHHKNTCFRNRVTGVLPTSPTWPGFFVSNRFGRWNNYVGNVQGTPGVIHGDYSFGNPNLGNAANSGLVSNSVLYRETGGVSGLLMKHVDGGGLSRISGTLTAKTGNNLCTITLTSGTVADLRPPHSLFPNLDPMFLHWSGGERHYLALDDASSGVSLVLSDVHSGVPPGGDNLPTLGTVITIYPGPVGCQELDGAVEYTAFKKANLVLGPGGAGGGIDVALAGGVTLPASLSGGQPVEWGTGMTFPPFDPFSPNYAEDATPSSYFYVHGDWPAGMDGVSSRVATPIFSPSAGSYGVAQSVTITCPTVGATIRYTTDDSDPTDSHGTIYSSPVSIPSTTRLKAVAYDGILDNSNIRSGTFTIGLACSDPIVSLDSGTYETPQSVTITCPTLGSTIRYTIDASEPSESHGEIYTIPIGVAANMSVRTIAYKTGLSNSLVVSRTYVIAAGNDDIVTLNADRVIANQLTLK